MDEIKNKIADQVFNASQEQLNKYESEADRILKETSKKSWYKHFTAVELALMFFGSGIFYIILNLLYFELWKYVISN